MSEEIKPEEVKAETRLDLTNTTNNMSYKEALNEWHIQKYISVKRGRNSEKTIHNFEGFVSQFRRYLALDDTPITAVTPEIITKYANYLLNDAKLAPTSVKAHFYSLKAFYNYLVDFDYISKNPMRQFDIESVKVEKKVPIFLTAEEISRMEKAALDMDNQMTFLLFETLLHTGVRVSELGQIKKCDIDFKELTLKVHGKGAKERVIFFKPELALYLEPYCRDFPDDALVFPCEGSYIEWHIRTLRRRAGIGKPITPHKLRTTFSTIYAKEDHNINALRKLLGHESLQTTQGYINYGDESVKKDFFKDNVTKIDGEKKSDKTSDE
jgi:site-specific recombinase XerD